MDAQLTDCRGRESSPKLTNWQGKFKHQMKHGEGGKIILLWSPRDHQGVPGGNVLTAGGGMLDYVHELTIASGAIVYTSR